MARKRQQRHPADNVVVRHSRQTPQQTRLRSDPCPSTVSWPFGDDVAEVFETLDAAHFRAWRAASRAQARLEARRLPVAQRAGFLAEHERWVAAQVRDRRAG